MNAEPCHEERQEVQAALEEWERIKAQAANTSGGDPVRTFSPPMGGDLGSRFYETVGREEAAHRRYRTAVRSLSECLRSQRLAESSR